MTDEPRFGKTKYATIRRDFGNLRTAIRTHDSFATETAWEKCERWMEALPTKDQAAHIAAQDAKIAKLVEALREILDYPLTVERHFDGPSPEDELDATVPELEALSLQEIASATLASIGEADD